jgi:hypothetical protein
MEGDIEYKKSQDFLVPTLCTYLRDEVRRAGARECRRERKRERERQIERGRETSLEHTTASCSTCWCVFSSAPTVSINACPRAARPKSRLRSRLRSGVVLCVSNSHSVWGVGVYGGPVVWCGKWVYEGVTIGCNRALGKNKKRSEHDGAPCRIPSSIPPSPSPPLARSLAPFPPLLSLFSSLFSICSSLSSPPLFSLSFLSLVDLIRLAQREGRDGLDVLQARRSRSVPRRSRRSRSVSVAVTAIAVGMHAGHGQYARRSQHPPANTRKTAREWAGRRR